MKQNQLNSVTYRLNYDGVFLVLLLFFFDRFLTTYSSLHSSSSRLALNFKRYLFLKHFSYIEKKKSPMSPPGSLLLERHFNMKENGTYMLGRGRCKPRTAVLENQK